MQDVNFLREPPFNLNDAALTWVTETFSDLDEGARITQLFCLRSDGDTTGEHDYLSRYRPGGIIRIFNTDRDVERARIDALNEAADVPLLVAADLEGSRMSLRYGTAVPNPLALASIDDVEVTQKVSAIMALEGADVGLNWSYTPVLDINAAFRSSIVASRGYGSCIDTISRHALAQIEAFQTNGVAATVKHWPGEGYDDRDQHLLTTINPLSIDEWRATFGRLYSEAIDAGALSVMSAHIAFPAYAQTMGAEGLEQYRPASMSRFLNLDLLRGELGFNGLIVSDASEMAGVTSWCPAPQSKVDILASGCDVLLMSSNPDEEISAVTNAIQSGEYPRQQFEQSVLRVLGLKAALGLHEKSKRIPVDYQAHQNYIDNVMTRAPTLVKDTQNLLPLDRKKHKRVLIVSYGIVEPMQGKSLDFVFPDLLKAEGFDVSLHKSGDDINTKSVDLVLYLMGEETLLTRGHIFLDWAKIGGNFVNAMQRTWHGVPTAMISFGYPYYLYDAPRMPTYINAYATMDSMQWAVVELLLGREDWHGSNPIDPFTGAPDARY